MDGVDERISRLLDVKGFGRGRIDRLVSDLGGVDRLTDVLERGDVAYISSADRISEKMAVDLILAYRGQDPETMLGTDGSREVFDSVRNRLRSCMRTSAARNRASLLLPCGDLREREKMAREHFLTRELLEGVDREQVEKDLSVIGRDASVRRTGMFSDHILVAESEEAQEMIGKHGLDRRCMVLSPEELHSGLEGDIILVYDRREIDERELPISASVHMNSPPEMMVPDIVLERFEGRMDKLAALSRLEAVFSKEGCAEEALDLVRDLKASSEAVSGPDQIRETVEEVRTSLESELKARIEGITLSGSEALGLLSSDEPPALRRIYGDISKKAVERIHERLGQKRDLFEMGYPLRTNEQALERMISDIEGTESSERFHRKQTLALKLSSMEKKIEEEFSWVLDLDYRFGMGCFVSDHDLNPFRVVEGWFGMKNGCHLMIRNRKDRQLVDYHLGKVPPHTSTIFPFGGSSSSRTALLTGANSGGKTTLLETIAQVLIMARMGLPVPAQMCFVPDIRNIFLYKPRRKLDAGGLEGFLKELLPLVLHVDKRSMVLADELEAMTELEAASRVIGYFVGELEKRDSYAVVVTHMADEIMRFVDCRVDGIEARGLDEDHELLVDRTPLIGKHARSTPELILRKLEAVSTGEEKRIYSGILSMFD